jgi:hypothetical protein
MLIELTAESRCRAAEGPVAEELLQDRLGVVEGAVDREGVHVGGAGARHLALLERRDPPVGIEDEDGAPGRPIRPWMAAAPVSPEVAPRTLIVSPRIAHWRA